MTPGRLVGRSLRFYGRSHLGVLLGAALATAVIAGALAVGDSVRYSLRQMARARLGEVALALHQPGRFFREALAAEIAPEAGGPVAPLILLRGAATGERADGSGGEVRVGQVQVLGVTPAFWALGRAAAPALPAEGAILNDRLARALAVRAGDEVLLRVPKPSLLSRDAPLSTIEDSTVTLRLKVAAVIDAAGFGRFSLEANQVPAQSAFLPLPALQKALGMEGRVNTLLVGGGASAETATRALWGRWRFADAGLSLRPVPGRERLELRTERVFLDPPVGEAAEKALPGAQSVLTYFVNELRVGARATPYSTVAALDGAPAPEGLRDDEVAINRWLAEDLKAKVGDTLQLSYWLVGPMRRLQETRAAFRIRAVLPLDGPARDPSLMPDIPGLADKKDCRDWEPGVPIDLAKIRDKDQAYWAAYRGTPKAFLTRGAGQRIWNNRFGSLTAVRYPASGPAARATIERALRQAINPAALGLFFVPVRERAQAASAASVDFGQLFLGLSLFLIVAALLLAALLFAFGVEQRAAEAGTLLALGFTPRRVRGLLLGEGALLAALAAVLGTLLALGYTRAALGGLSGIWSGAVAGAALTYHVELSTLAVGALAGAVMALLSIALVARRQARAPARELLAAGAESASRWLRAPSGRRLPGLATALVCFALAGALSAAGGAARETGGAGLFFGAGALLLAGGIAGCRALLAALERGGGGRLRIGGLGRRNSVRRAGRSLAAIALFACGSFLTVAVGANRHDPGAEAGKRASGTGGFALYGEASLPVYQDLNAADGREAFGLEASELAGARILPLRLREGDEASCLNLNRAQTPRLLGVEPAALAGRFVFSQAPQGGWGALERPERDGAIPVIGDTNTVVWSLGKKRGATLEYVDDRGTMHRLRIVGVLANSILQGSLLLSEANFTRLFPNHSGYQTFLVDAPPAAAREVGAALTRGLEDVGLSLTPATERLAAFHTVENAYLSIFAALGGLALLLGSVGLGVIVLRNVWERRGELALLRAVGWTRGQLHRLVFGEHALLLTLGLAVGGASALLAVLPALRAPGAEVPVVSLGVTLLLVFGSGFLWTALATALALRTPLLEALRQE